MLRRRSISLAARGVIATVAAAMALVVMTPTAAHAALDTPISGTTSSDNDLFYLSSNVRTITTDLYYLGQAGNVHINIDVAPKLSNGTPDGLRWRLYKVYSQQYTDIWILGQDPAYWRNLGFIDYPGRHFRNSFTRTTDCPNCNHSFSGNMNY